MKPAVGEPQQRVFFHAPKDGVSPRRDLESCLSALDCDLHGRGLPRTAVLKLTFFLRAGSGFHVAELQRELYPIVDEFFSGLSPSAGWVGQPPEENAFVGMEALIQASLAGVQVKHRKWEEHDYVVLLDPPHKILYAGGLGDRKAGPGITAASRAAFEKLRKLLLREGMGFSNIVRQWNYIEGILTRTEKGNRQHYQIFNDMRGRFYGTDHFDRGFPAATGIGQKSGGVIIDCIAVRGNADNEVFPLKNPGQVDAHQYSQEVLVGETSSYAGEKAPPQFERGKLLRHGHSGTIFISGTASIVGETTVGSGDVAQQTRTTISNIARLVSSENLAESGIRTAPGLTVPAGLRIYVKNEEDIPCVKAICGDLYGDVPALFVAADICRPDLLVEIEGMLYVKLMKSTRS